MRSFRFRHLIVLSLMQKILMEEKYQLVLKGNDKRFDVRKAYYGYFSSDSLME